MSTRVENKNAPIDKVLAEAKKRMALMKGPAQPVVSSPPGSQSGRNRDSVTPHYAWLIAMYLQDRCNENKHLDGTHLTRFHSSRIPPIGIADYFRRIDKYSSCSTESHLVALIYMERYCEAAQVPITFRNVHRLGIVSVMISAKVRDDIFYSNQYFSSIGGVSNTEINDLELEFLAQIKWNTWVEMDEFQKYEDVLVQRFGTGPPPIAQAGAAAGAKHQQQDQAH